MTLVGMSRGGDNCNGYGVCTYELGYGGDMGRFRQAEAVSQLYEGPGAYRFCRGRKTRADATPCRPQSSTNRKYPIS